MKFLLGLVMTFTTAFAGAAVQTETIEYKDGDTVLEGFLAYPKGLKGKRPVVMIVHEWTGLGDYVKGRAKQLADMGYVAFALDIYGKGVRPAPPEAGKVAATYKDNRPLMRQRAKAGYDFIKKHKLADSSRMIAMGYCFGGTTALEMGRSGLDLAGIVSFHGGLAHPSPEDVKNIKGPVLVLHGAVDPNVPFTEVENFEKEMNEAKKDYQLIKYSGAVHAFTNKDAGNDPSKGAAYDAKADKRSWIAFRDFLAEVAPVRK